MKKFKNLAAIALSAAMFVSSVIGASAATYTSELTGLPIDSSIQNQRPVAIMVDNEKVALDHYGISLADIQYEMINSTANNRITRSMFIVKDWGKISRFGNIRSTRSTNMMLAPEYNAVLVHDGGPYYINFYFNNPFVYHLSGGFSRIDNGKRAEFTEYVTTGQIASRMKAAGISTNYDNYRTPGSHFNFGATNLDAMPGVRNATSVKLPFPKTQSALKFNAAKGTYEHYLYGTPHKDAGAGNVVVDYTNVIIQNVSIAQLDSNGYMVYNILGQGEGFYMTGGKAIPIKWVKPKDQDVTKFYDSTGKEIVMTPGKTYIGLVPSDSWSQLAIS